MSQLSCTTRVVQTNRENIVPIIPSTSHGCNLFIGVLYLIDIIPSPNMENILVHPIHLHKHVFLKVFLLLLLHSLLLLLPSHIIKSHSLWNSILRWQLASRSVPFQIQRSTGIMRLRRVRSLMHQTEPNNPHPPSLRRLRRPKHRLLGANNRYHRPRRLHFPTDPSKLHSQRLPFPNPIFWLELHLLQLLLQREKHVKVVADFLPWRPRI